MGVEAGTLIAGRFRVISELGRGGMAVVYLAEDTLRPGPPIALKLVPPSAEEDDVSLRRFRREAEMLSKLRHPHILELLESGPTDAGGLWISMPRLVGEDLDQRLRRGRLPAEEARRIGREIALALAHAHAQGVVHRDLKPSNVFLESTPSGSITRVLDFGIARVFNDPALTRITNSGRTLGSPGYMSPEQILGTTLDGRSDLYTLGVLLFQMLTGRPPLPVSGDMFSVLRAHLEQPAPLISEVAPELAVESDLEALVASMLEKDPSRRPREATSVVARLARATGDSIPKRPGATSGRRPSARPSAAVLLSTVALGAGAVLAVVAVVRARQPEVRPPADLAPVLVVPPPSTASAETPRVEVLPPAAPVTPSIAATVAASSVPPPKKARPKTRASALEATPAVPGTRVRAPMPNDASVRENIDRLRNGPTSEERTAARASLISLLRQTIAALPPPAQPELSRELAGLAAAGSAAGFARFHQRVRAVWAEDSSR